MATVARVIPVDLSARYEALLRAGRSIATCNDCENAGRELSRHLREIIFFDYSQVVVFNAQTDAVEWQLLEVNAARLNVPPGDQDTPLVSAHHRQALYLLHDWTRYTHHPP